MSYCGKLGRSVVAKCGQERFINLFRLQPRTYATASAELKNTSSTSPKSKMSSTSFAMNVFRGELQSDYVFPYPDVLSEEEKQTLKLIIQPAEKFFAEVNDPTKNDEIEAMEPHSMDGLKSLGAFGLQVPEHLGGMGLTNTQYARITEVVGANDLGVSILVGAHQSIGFKGIILFGTEDQKKKYLPKLASGQQLAAFALTEPTVGSDASGIKCRAELSADGKFYMLNGSKIWISNGGTADVYTVFAQTTKKGETTGPISAFIVERAFGGLTSGPPEKKLGIKASNTAEVFFDDVKIPVENIIGEVGGGFKVAMNILNNGRFGMASCLSGTMKTCIHKAVEHASNRSQFGNKIHKYGTIQEKIARMVMKQYATESMAYMLSASMDSGASEFQIEAAISKVYASEAAWFCTDEAIQILGGSGFMKATGLERYMRDLRIFRIFEGTNDILRLFIALTGMQFAGKHLENLGRAFKNPTANIGEILGAGQKRARRLIGISAGPPLSELVHSDLDESAKLVSQSIDNFGATVEQLLMTHGKKIVEEQFVLKRVGEAAMELYVMVAVLSRASRSLTDNHASAAHEKLLCSAICQDSHAMIRENLRMVMASDSQDFFRKLSNISNDVIDNEDLLPQHPLLV